MSAVAAKYKKVSDVLRPRTSLFNRVFPVDKIFLKTYKSLMPHFVNRQSQVFFLLFGKFSDNTSDNSLWIRQNSTYGVAGLFSPDRTYLRVQPMNESTL